MEMKKLYIGQTNLGSTSRMRFESLEELLGEKFDLVDLSQIIESKNRITRSVGWRFFRGPLIWKINLEIKKKVLESRTFYDLIWVDKGVFIKPKILKELKKRTKYLIHYTPDTAFYENNSRFFRRGIDFYDYLITTKSFELAKYKSRVSEEKLIYLTQGINSSLHKPSKNFFEKSDTITFIGLNEPYREEVITCLIQNGFHIILGGFGWQRFIKRQKLHSDKIKYIGESILNEEYADAISQSKFALGLLSKKFPESHTTRTFEIPSCATCLITEENEEINSFFTDEECLKFKDQDDLLNKVNFYHTNPKILESLINNGYLKVQSLNVNYKTQLKVILDKIYNYNL
jgi:spore maturation protein CgeB